MQKPNPPPDISTLIQLPTDEALKRVHDISAKHADADVRLLAAIVVRLCPAIEAIGKALPGIAAGNFVSLDQTLSRKRRNRGAAIMNELRSIPLILFCFPYGVADFHAQAGRIRGMNEKRESGTGLPLIVVASLLFLGLAAAYVAGYFGLSRMISNGDEHRRTFRAHWMVTIYRPGAYVESAMTGKDVDTGYWNWP